MESELYTIIYESIKPDEEYPVFRVEGKANVFGLVYMDTIRAFKINYEAKKRIEILPSLKACFEATVLLERALKLNFQEVIENDE